MSLVDGYELKYVSRTHSAERRRNGRLLDTIRVAWVTSWRNAPPVREPDALPSKGGSKKSQPRDAFVEISFKDADEMAEKKKASMPFVVALAHAKPKGERGSSTEFRGVFEVAPTGVELSPTSLETKVIRRVTADGESGE